MKHFYIFFLLSFLCGCPSKESPLPTAAIPESREGYIFPDGSKWDDYIMEFQKITSKKEDIDILWLGDSITEFWKLDENKKVYEEYFGQYKSYNFSIRGDCTQHLLWRIENSNFSNISPKIVILLIGANNWMDTAQNTAIGVIENAKAIRRMLPNSKLILLGIFPQKISPEDPIRIKIDATNEILSKFKQENTFYYNIGNIFVAAGGIIPQKIMPDFLHLSEEGYKKWAEVLSGIITNFYNK
jgi:lysophospholipase L1-like esterase